MTRTPRHGLWSGVGVNIGVMVGTGVFVSAGFMAETMGPELILWAWVVGGVLAMAGARAYAEVAAIVPRSGGEYRFLSDLFHPWVGTLAGWTSLLAGFSAPVASSAATAGFFAATLFPDLDPRVVGVAIIGGNTLVHAFHHGVSKLAQDLLAAAKVVLVVGFIAAGLALGRSGWPAFAPLHAPASGTVANFMAQLVFVMYAYTGWNSAVYAAEEYHDAKRTVPRSMVIAAAAVMVIYVAVNWVLTANLSSDTARAFLAADAGKVTLGHLITEKLLGPAGGKVMSLLVVLVLISSVSSMTMIGPRVYQVMAQDGFMPRVLAGRADRPPLLSVLIQGALALLIFFTNSLAELIGNITVLLTLTSALTAATLFKVRGAAPVARVAAVVYVALSAWMLYAVFVASPRTLWWPAIIVVASTVAYLVLRPSRADRL